MGLGISPPEVKNLAEAKTKKSQILRRTTGHTPLPRTDRPGLLSIDVLIYIGGDFAGEKRTWTSNLGKNQKHERRHYNLIGVLKDEGSKCQLILTNKKIPTIII